MLNRMNRYKWLLAAWIILSSTLCPAQVYTSMQSTSSMMNANCSGATNTGSRQGVPAYRFQSTSTGYSGVSASAYAPKVSEPYASNPYGSGKRKSSPWDSDPDEDNEIGVANQVPIGDIPLGLFVLLLFGYLALKRLPLRKTN